MISVDASKAIKGIEANVIKKSKAVNKALIVSAFEVSDFIKKSITAHKSRGRAYTRRTVTHIASLPGYAPNGDTGFLAFSTQPSRRVKNHTTEVIVGASYARALEFGTRNMRRRPFISPAKQALGYKISQRIRKAMNAS